MGTPTADVLAKLVLQPGMCLCPQGHHWSWQGWGLLALHPYSNQREKLQKELDSGVSGWSCTSTSLGSLVLEASTPNGIQGHWKAGGGHSRTLYVVSAIDVVWHRTVRRGWAHEMQPVKSPRESSWCLICQASAVWKPSVIVARMFCTEARERWKVLGKPQLFRCQWVCFCSHGCCWELCSPAELVLGRRFLFHLKAGYLIWVCPSNPHVLTHGLLLHFTALVQEKPSVPKY